LIILLDGLLYKLICSSNQSSTCFLISVDFTKISLPLVSFLQLDKNKNNAIAHTYLTKFINFIY
jgi:hypothetical protein